MSKATVEKCCHVSASKTKNVFRYASGFEEELLRYEVSATMDRMIAEVSRVDERAVVAELQQRIVSLELENAYLRSMLGPVAPKRRGHKRRRVHLQRPPADSETANAATRNWRNAFLKIPRDAPPVPFQMPPPPTVPPEAAPH